MRPSLLEYTLPTSMDVPEMKALIVESVDPEGPYGAKEAGEGPLHGSLPALANAIYDATGVWLTKLPFTPPRVLAALRAAGVTCGADVALRKALERRAGGERIGVGASVMAGPGTAPKA
jgi:hypothetical protein